MKTATILSVAALWMGLMTATAQAEGKPSIRFEKMVYDFGKTSQVATVSGVFKFKNDGDAILKVEPPAPSCGCTVAGLKPDTLRPGESGELAFTINLGLYRATLEKHIVVRSNDPLTPEVSLTIKADYTPLYDISPMTLAPDLVFGTDEAVQFATLTRTDGKPIRILRLDPSKPWIKAVIEPGAGQDDAATRVRVVIQREGSPRRFSEFIQVYAAGETNTPVASLYVHGRMLGEVSLSPEALYWNITDAAKMPAERPEAQVVQRLAIRSAEGKTIRLKNPQSTIKGLKVELVPKEAGKSYELVARLDEVPAATVSGNVSFETSVADQSRIEVPVIVNVTKQ
jgi:hypothetical protein